MALLAGLWGCVPSRAAVLGPVDRELARRLGDEAPPSSRGASGPRDPRVAPAITALLARPLDREAAVRIALARNARLQAQYEQLGVAASEVAAATVLAPARVALRRELGATGEVELEVTQDVLELLLLAPRRGAARAGLEAARARAVAATLELVAQVEASHVELVAAQQVLELDRTAYDAASASAELVERMHAAGNATDLALARERDRREQTRLDLTRAQLAIEERREALNQVLGLSGREARYAVLARLPEVPEAAPALGAIERDAVAASLALAAIRSDAEAAAARLGVARVRAWLPELGLGAAASRRDGEWALAPTLSFGLPIFNQQQGPRARAHAELRRARHEASATETELRAAARAARRRVLQAHAEARALLAVVLPLRQRVVDETLKQYNAMNASTFELLAARRELVDGGRRYIDALRRFWRASAETRALRRGAMPQLADGRAAALSSPASPGDSTRTEGHAP